MKLFKRNKGDKRVGKKSFGFSVPFLTLPNGYNSSKPYISNHHRKGGFVPYGSDNMYVSIVRQAYHLSPVHNACIDMTVNCAYDDYNMKGKDIDVKAFNIKNDVDKMIKQMLYNLKMFDAVYVLVDKTSIIPTMKVIDSEQVRFNNDKTTAFICADWSTNYDIKSYSTDDRDDVYLAYYHKDSFGSDGIYPIIHYNSILNLIESEQEITYMFSQSIKNSINPSMVVSLPYQLETNEEMEDLKEIFSSRKGSKSAGDVIVLMADGADNLPIITKLDINKGMDKLFETNLNIIKNRIALTHKMPLVLLESTAGSLGQSNEIKEAYKLFTETVASKYTDNVSLFFNKLLKPINLQIIINHIDYNALFDEEVDVDTKGNR